MGLIGSPETSVLNRLKPRNNTESGKIQHVCILFKVNLFAFNDQMLSEDFVS
jgi:hypothetical protein